MAQYYQGPFNPQYAPMLPNMPSFPPQFAPVVLVDNGFTKLMAAGLQPRLTNLWVGKISPLVEDFIIKELLCTCGSVNNWQRVKANDIEKNFGFCKYTNAEGALRALRLLNGIRVGDDELHVKVDQTTTDYLNDYEKKKKAFLEQERKLDPSNETHQATYIQYLDDEDGDKTAKEQIDKIIENVTKALMNDVEGSSGVVSKEVRLFRERQIKIDRERKEKEEEIDRQRRRKEDDERREKRRVLEREEREFGIKEKSWLEHERNRDREKKRYYEDLKENQIRRKQFMMIDDDDEKSNRIKIRSRDAKRRREKERERDDQGRIKDAQARVERAEREKKEEEKRIILAEKARIEAVLEAERLEKSKGQFKAEEELVLHNSDSDKKSNSFSVSLNFGGTTKPKTTNITNNTNTMFSADSGDTEEGKKKRKLMVLEDEVGNHDHNKREKKEDDAPLDKKAKLQQIIDRIPTEKSELFRFSIDWDIVDEKNIVDNIMKGWITKKIIEYLGEEEEQLIEFICKKLRDHTDPDTILDLLLLVLEEEANDFVIRMWRMLIYTILNFNNI